MRNRNTPIALEGIPFILGALVPFFLFAWFRLTLPTLFFGLVAGFVVFFFRNPRRTMPGDEKAVIAPADGLVIYLGTVQEPHLATEMQKISIFMSVFNVHVNRVPVSGRILDRFYRSGKFLDVRDERATFENEQLGLVIETGAGLKMVVVQVAGLIARRIVCYPETGTMLRRGDIYGLIRFGSRLDVYLPLSAKLNVAMGDKTVAGETILGILP